jgi:hypothetical protein
VSNDYMNHLRDALSATGIRGRLRTRILVELEDHLRCDPNANLGSPPELARQFADEHGTSRARRGVVATFAALALAGILFAATFIAATNMPGSTSPGMFRSAQAQGQALAILGGAIAAIAAQVAFATGLLAALRLLWRRDELVLSRTEATVIVRRTAIALGSGIATMAGVALMALEVTGSGGSSWPTLALIASSVGAAVLIAVAPTVLSAARLLPTATGDAGDIFDDLGPFVPTRLRGRPWLLALTVAIALGVGVALVGVIASDPYDGILRGIAEALACFAGFTVLGSYIGLRPAAA